jgi:hypothetical protein
MSRNIIPLLFASMTIPLSAAEVVRQVAVSDLGLPPEATATGMHLGDPAIADGEVLLDHQQGSRQVLLIRMPAAGAVRGLIIAYPDAQPDAPEPAADAKPDGAKPAAKPKRIPFTLSAQAFAMAQDGSERMHSLESERFKRLLTERDRGDRFSSIIPVSIDQGTRAWWAQRLERASGIAQATPEEIRQRRRGGLDETVDLFSGLTALNENLQLDRRLAITGGDAATVALDSLPTLQAKEVPWERMAGAKDAAAPRIDLLAGRIPVDQHAVFFPSFSALVTAIRQADETLSGPLQVLAGHGEDAGTQQRYQRQLGLELNELSKRFGAQVIDQVALTGSDPYLRTGSDVAVLLHARQPALLATYLTLRLQGLIQAGAAAKNGMIGNLSWLGAVNADRSQSCFVLVDGDTAVIANSLAQLDAYAAVRTGARPALAGAPELAFFRRRYAPDDSELALAVVSDATIRRWCSARWRIGDSRRTRAHAVLASLQADWIAAGCPATWTPTDVPADLGAITVGANGVRSSLYGSLAFMTPIAELDLAKATIAEAEAYKRFLERYQRSWRDYFDPIAARLQTTTNGRIGIDLSVLPLIVGSEYRELLRLTGKAVIAPGAGDPHAALLHYVIALDPQGGLLSGFDRDASGMLGGLASPLGWVGSSAAVYADPDPAFWADLVKPTERGRMTFLQRNLSRIPVGVNIAVRDQLKLAAFLTGIRGMAAQAAPGLVTWGTRMWKEVTYVVVSPSQQGRAEFDAELFYLPAPEGLTITLNEGVMQRAIDRLVAARAAAGKPDQASQWLGGKLAASVQPPFLAQLSELDERGGMRRWMDGRMGSDIAILNEWHRLFPQEDPVAVHERLWNTRLVCPYGGTYRWNEAWLTMEATAVGAPDDGRELPTYPAAFSPIASLSAGIAFDELPSQEPPKPDAGQADERRGDERTSIGLRARLEIEPAAAPAAKP